MFIAWGKIEWNFDFGVKLWQSGDGEAFGIMELWSKAGAVRYYCNTNRYLETTVMVLTIIISICG